MACFLAVADTPGCFDSMLAIKMDTTAATRAPRPPRPSPRPPLRLTPLPACKDDGAAATIERVASRLRDTRRARGMTLDELSANSGVSRTALSQIERQKCNPSLASLWKIAAGLGLSFVELLDLPLGDNTAVVRAGAFDGDRDKPPRLSRLLAPLAMTPWGQAQEFTLPAESCERMSAHPPGTRELVIVLEGTLRVLLGRNHYELGEGDSLVAFADVSRGYETIGPQPVRFHVFVLSPR